MDGVAGGILINIASTALWVLSGALLLKLYGVYRIRRETTFNRLAQMSQSVKTVHLTYGLVDPTAPSTTSLVQEGDVSAICSALSLLQDVFGASKVLVLSPQAANAQFGTVDNLVSVSGPIWNAITRTLLQGSPIPVSFGVRNGDDALIDSMCAPPACYMTVRESDIARECYGLVYRGCRETSADRRCRSFVVAGGISALGTYAAVTWLRKCATQPLRENSFVQQLRRHDHALLLLKVSDRSPHGFHAYSAGPESPGFLTIEVIAQYISRHVPHAQHDNGAYQPAEAFGRTS